MADQLNDPMVLQNIISRISPAVLLALEPSQLNDAAFLRGVLNRITAAPAPTQSEPAPAETQSHLSIPRTVASINRNGSLSPPSLSVFPNTLQSPSVTLECKSGHKNHPDIHPFFNLTIGPKKELCSIQSVPCQSNLIWEDLEGAKVRDNIFPIVFQVIQQAISSGLLSESDELEFFVQELPFDTSPVMATKDRDLCATMPFAEWEGGQIVFYQLDIFANLNPLDIVIFPSNHIIHFNLCHKHKHGSVVTSTDKGFDAWVKDENGYAGENFGVGVFKQSNVLVVAE
ncbi:hypothetical protein C8J56DRAFT_1060581 [Mycena floridula]|nr:hypothetical protein C8J56DRAFT_1060581 [Mycena floridula]